MSQRAHVTSVEALETFRSQLIVHIEKLTGATDDVNDEVMRTRVWLANDQLQHLLGLARRQSKVLEMAQQELFSSRISSLETTTMDRQLAVRKAKLALDETLNKLTTVKKWNRQFESEVAPLAKQVEKLRTMLGTDMEKAVAYLAQTINTLDDYARIKPPAAGPVAIADIPPPENPPA